MSPREYPQRHALGDGEVVIRKMTADDAAALSEFAGQLNSHDLLFLRRDITSAEVQELWLQEIRDGVITTLFAEVEGRVVGYATLDRSRLPWSSHVGELRVLVVESQRGKGLGRILTQEIFACALGEGIEKIVARMTLDQQGAIAVFEGLGFKPEGLLKDHVQDREGERHDLLVLCHDVAEFEATLSSYGVTEALADA